MSMRRWAALGLLLLSTSPALADGEKPAEEKKPAPKVALTVEERGPGLPWKMTVANQGDVATKVVADPRLLWFDVRVPGKKKLATCRLPEGLFPKKVDKREETRSRDRATERTKTKVRQRDRYQCRVCERHTKVVHEGLPRSIGGAVSPENSFCACDVLDGGRRGSAVTGSRLRVMGPGGLLGHRHSLLEAEGFCECFAMVCVVPVQG